MFPNKEDSDKEAPRHLNKEDSGNQHMHNFVDQHQDNLTKVGMVVFGYVGLKKELEEHLDKVYIIALWDSASSRHKVGLIGIVPC